MSRGSFRANNPNIKELTNWFNWAGATDTGTLSIPDRFGGSPAVQATGALKPTLATADNGVKIGIFSTNILAVPLSATTNDSIRFGWAAWVKLTNVVGIKTFISINNFVGGANIDKLLCNTFGASLETRAQSVDRHAQIPGLDTNWHFCYTFIDCSKSTEAAQVSLSIDGVAGTVAFNSDTAWPSSMPVPTGNMIIGGNSLVPGSPLVGSIGDIYIFMNPLSTKDQVRLMQFNRPL